ncbi:MAG: hypothetical protein QM783_14615 [Phycisphaerales bacterium]
MRTSTPAVLSTLLLLAAAGTGCSTNSSMVERFDPATPTTSTQNANTRETAANAKTNGKTTQNTANRTGNGGMTPTTPVANTAHTQPTLRTGPITPEWIAQMEASGKRNGAPVIDANAVAEEKPTFDRGSLTFTAGTDKDTPADATEGLTQVTFATEGADFDPRISRDGSTLVFASTQHRATADLYIKKVGAAPSRSSPTTRPTT